MNEDLNLDELQQAVAAEPPAAPELNGFQDDEERRIAAKLIPSLTFRVAAQVRTKLEAEAAEALKRKVDALSEENRRMIEAEVQKIRDAAKPPDAASIQKLLDQEYLEFTVKVSDRHSGRKHEFVIRELPLEAEKKLVKTIEKKIIPALKHIGKKEFSGSMEEKLQKVMDALPTGLDTFAELAAVCLNPWNEDEKIDSLWVTQNISAFRILNIILAQIEAGRLRDFFSGIYRLIPETTVV